MGRVTKLLWKLKNMLNSLPLMVLP